jgi:hypothetical protein
MEFGIYVVCGLGGVLGDVILGSSFGALMF